MFTLQGRMGRMAYFITTCACGVMLALSSFIFLQVAPPAVFLSPEMSLNVLGAIVGIIAFAWLWSATVRRLHDINLSGMWSLLVYLVPALLFVLWFWPGTLTFNRFDLY